MKAPNNLEDFSLTGTLGMIRVDTPTTGSLSRTTFVAIERKIINL